MHHHLITRPYTVLILDDDPEILLILQEMIKSIYGNELVIYTKNDPLDAMQLIKNEQINILITDIKMPILPGDVLLQKIREMQRGTEVIIVTGDSTLSLCITCFYDGATAFIHKPFNGRELRNAIDLSVAKLDLWSSLFNKTIENRINATKDSQK